MIGNCSQKMSCVPPLSYKRRFDKYMEGVILSNNDDNHYSEKNKKVKK